VLSLENNIFRREGASANVKFTYLADLVKANNITDFIVSKWSDNEAFSPKPFK